MKNCYYISSGFGNGMFTLREHSVFKTNYGLKEEDRYIKTLARDYDKAVAKAKEYVGENGKLEISKPFELAKWGEAEKNYRYIPPVLSDEEIAKREAEAKVKAEEKAKREAEYAEVLRLRQEEYDRAEPIPVTNDRIRFKGTVEGTYSKETQWGIQHKMFLIDDRGFKINGTNVKVPYIDSVTGKPEIINEGTEDEFERKTFVKKGDRVSFIAKVQPSDDPKFGFFKRPTNIKEIS